MRTRIVIGGIAGLMLGAFAVIAPMASAAPKAAVPPVCVHHKLPHHLNLQVGYCP